MNDLAQRIIDDLGNDTDFDLDLTRGPRPFLTHAPSGETHAVTTFEDYLAWKQGLRVPVTASLGDSRAGMGRLGETRASARPKL